MCARQLEYKMQFRDTDSLIFDMDGTLWDATDTYAEAWNMALRELKIDKVIQRKDLESLMGLEEKAVLQRVFPDESEDRQKVIANLIWEKQDEHIPKAGGKLYEGVKEGLEQLSKIYKLFIVSNCPENTINDFITWAGIKQLFTDHETHGRTKKSKGENIKLIIERNNLKNAVYIGDTISDEKASKEAGVPFVFVNYGFGKPENVGVEFSSFPELTNYFLNLKSKP